METNVPIAPVKFLNRKIYNNRICKVARINKSGNISDLSKRNANAVMFDENITFIVTCLPGVAKQYVYNGFTGNKPIFRVRLIDIYSSNLNNHFMTQFHCKSLM